MTTTTLTYAIEPAQVFVATSTDLTLTITNPIDGVAVEFFGGRDPSVILVTIPVGSDPSDLTTADTFTASTDTPGFSVSLSNAQYQVTSSESAGSTLNPGDVYRATYIGRI